MKIRRSENAFAVNIIRIYFIIPVTAALSGACAVFSSAAAVAAAAVGLLTAFIMAVSLKRRLAAFEVVIETGRVTVSSGVLIKKKRNAESEQIVYVKFLQTALQRRYGVCTAVINLIKGKIVIADISDEDIESVMQLGAQGDNTK